MRGIEKFLERGGWIVPRGYRQVQDSKGNLTLEPLAARHGEGGGYDTEQNPKSKFATGFCTFVSVFSVLTMLGYFVAFNTGNPNNFLPVIMMIFLTPLNVIFYIWSCMALPSAKSNIYLHHLINVPTAIMPFILMTIG